MVEKGILCLEKCKVIANMKKNNSGNVVNWVQRQEKKEVKEKVEYQNEDVLMFCAEQTRHQ